MELLQYVNEAYLFLIPALWALGAALKKTPRVPDWSIIWVLFLISITLAVFAFGFTPEAVVNAIVAAASAVFSHQLVKQTVRSKAVPPSKPTIRQDDKNLK